LRIPRELPAAPFKQVPQELGYSQDRQAGIYMRLTTTSAGEHHVPSSKHYPLRSGALWFILDMWLCATD
jgi:hypothetical protein